MNVYGDSGGMDALNLNLSIKWEWQLQARSIFTPEKASTTQGIEDSVRSRGGLDAIGKRKKPLLMSEIEPQFLGRPARSITTVLTETLFIFSVPVRGQ